MESNSRTGNFDELVKVWRSVYALAECPEHQYGTDRLAVFPEQVQQGVSSGARCPDILNPRRFS